ncbi:acetyl-CoA carboxylase biotin carboxyl carrier protein [bacterium]|nr:acetyl-CoA carboxylase biotin carboxyl carrier protein [bacterium]
MDIRKIRQLARMLQSEGLDELELKDGNFYLRLKKTVIERSDGLIREPIQIDEPLSEEEKNEDEVMIEGEMIPSPLAGTFYRSKAPGAPPFVAAGEDVVEGRTLCILEAMKLMNELEADVDCKIIEILIEDGQTVSEGEALFRIIVK